MTVRTRLLRLLVDWLNEALPNDLQARALAPARTVLLDGGVVAVAHDLDAVDCLSVAEQVWGVLESTQDLCVRATGAPWPPVAARPGEFARPFVIIDARRNLTWGYEHNGNVVKSGRPFDLEGLCEPDGEIDIR